MTLLKFIFHINDVPFVSPPLPLIPSSLFQEQLSDHAFHPPQPKQSTSSEILSRYEPAPEPEDEPSNHALQVVVPADTSNGNRYGGGTPLKIHIPEGSGQGAHSSSALLPGPSNYGSPYPSPNGIIRWVNFPF